MADTFVPVAQSRVQQLRKSMAALGSGQVISMLSSLAVVPVYLAWWSAGRYGEWLTLASLVAYLAAFDFGMNAAGGNKLIQEYARGDLDAYRRYQRSALAVYLAIAVIGGLVLTIIVFTLPVTDWLGIRLTDHREAKLSLLLLGLQILWGMPGGFLIGIYRTLGNLARSEWVLNLQTILSMSLSLLCLPLHGGMIAVAAVQLLCAFGTSVCVLLDVNRRHPEVMPRIARVDLAAVRELIKPSALFGLVLVSEALRLQGAILLVSSRMGGAAVAVFVSSRTLCNSARQFTSAMTNAMWPHVTALEANQRHSTIRMLHRLWVVISTAVCLSIAAVLWFEGPDVIRVWTRGRLTADVLLLRLLLVQLVLQAPWLASSLITAASNQHGKLAHAYLWSSIVGLGAAWLLMGRLGAAAVPAGGILAEAAICYHFVIHDTCTVIGERYVSFAVRQWLYLLLAAALALLTGRVTHAVAFGPDFARWAQVGAAVVTAVGTLTWFVGLRSDERSEIKSVFRRAISRRVIARPAPI